jgi:hypothetical protein
MPDSAPSIGAAATRRWCCGEWVAPAPCSRGGASPVQRVSKLIDPGFNISSIGLTMIDGGCKPLHRGTPRCSDFGKCRNMTDHHGDGMTNGCSIKDPLRGMKPLRLTAGFAGVPRMVKLHAKVVVSQSFSAARQLVDAPLFAPGPALVLLIILWLVVAK